MQIPGYFEDMNYLHVNTEPDRAYYIPASGKGCYFLDREKSDRFLLLSGSWQFQYFESVYDLPQEFWKEGREKRCRFLPYGRVTAWMETSISTPGIHFPLTRPMCRGKIPAGCMNEVLSTNAVSMLRRHF